MKAPKVSIYRNGAFWNLLVNNCVLGIYESYVQAERAANAYLAEWQ